MKKEPNLLVIFPVFFLLHTTLTTSAVDYYQTCQPYTCGNLNITYPFYFPGYQQSYCGEPGFDISCLSNKYPAINLSNHLYNITFISYSEKYIQISDSAFNPSSSFDSTHDDVLLTCPNSIHNLTLEVRKFTYSSNTRSMFLFFNCSQTVLKTLPTRSKINCSNNKTIVALYEEDSGQYEEVKKGCGEMNLVPYMVEDHQEDAEKVLENGFSLNWSANNCRACQDSGGRCGYTNDTSEFKCFCPDRPHSYSCDHRRSDSTQENGVSGDGGENKSQRKRMLDIFLPTCAGIMLLLGFIFYYYLKRRQGSGGKGREEKGRVKTSRTTKGGFNSLETNADGLRAFSLRVIKESTNNFAFCNKLGQGGYGPVYKGSLEDGQVIAVKRLSDSSKQGLEEFENEVTLLARLQHVNLVRILGFCTEGGEKMLIYDYMPNGSLDSYLFDPIKRLLLDWRKRVQIVEGVIQGLLYLQEYSRLSIIHRDIKPSNVLLDIAMIPKIADFGMARIFQKNDPEANTGKIVGTYGYVSPEYATRGAYSVKLDVYSFGVLLLQVISGKTTFSSYGLTGIQALSDQAYEMWEEGKGKEFTDPTLDDTNSTCSMTTCLQVALLCVQDNPEDRPTMLEVSSMINSETKDLPIPNIPAFSVRRGCERHTMSSQSGYTVNEATISELIPR